VPHPLPGYVLIVTLWLDGCTPASDGLEFGDFLGGTMFWSILNIIPEDDLSFLGRVLFYE
jgi:hypothetical protein